MLGSEIGHGVIMHAINRVSVATVLMFLQIHHMNSNISWAIVLGGIVRCSTCNLQSWRVS